MRIVSLVPSVTETLFELGLDDQIIAITRFCRLPAEKVKLKPKVGGTKNPKLDDIVQLKPDVVIMDRDENRKQDAEFLKRNGIDVFATFPRSVEEGIQVIADLGKKFQVVEKANRMIEEIRQRMKMLTIHDRKRALILIWRNPYMTVNRDTYVHAISALFGFDNVFADHQERYPKLKHEEIVACKAEVVLMPDEPYPFRQRHVEELRALEAQFLLFDGTYITWPGYGMLRALRELSAGFSRHRKDAGFSLRNQ
jgi:ABC-type Fe3+-hydroxamate transport system substrate-binding protein